jgi:hypothetical protein
MARGKQSRSNRNKSPKSPKSPKAKASPGFSSIYEQRLLAESKYDDLVRKTHTMSEEMLTPKLVEDIWAWGMFAQTLSLLEFIDE